MIFPESKRIFYDRNTLYRVVLQLRFSVPLRIDGKPEDFRQRVEQMCPAYKTMPMQFEDGSKRMVHVFRDETGGRSIELSENALTIVFIEYRRWEDFLDFHLKSLAALTACYGEMTFSRIGLRYVDRFIDTELGAKNWGDLLKAPFIGLIGMDDGSLKGFQVMQELNLGKPNAKVMIITSSLIRDKLCCGVQLDYDCSFNETTSAGEIMRKLEYLHVQSRNIFEFVITEELRSIMGVREQ